MSTPLRNKILFTVIALTIGGGINAPHAENKLTLSAQAADPARARIRLRDYQKIKETYQSTANTARAEILKLPPLELHGWFGDKVKILSTHDVNRQKDLYHAYKIFIWQNIGDRAYLVMAGKKLGRHEKIYTYNECGRTKIKKLTQFKTARFNRHTSHCQVISALAFEEYNCAAETYCKKNLTVGRHRKGNKYLLLYPL